MAVMLDMPVIHDVDVVCEVQRITIEECLKQAAEDDDFAAVSEKLQVNVLGAIQNDWLWLHKLLQQELRLVVWCYENGIELPQT
ncbi:MAG: hypothetical protein EBR79_03710 [Proteobacteria bacterium]|nr:hypothetical protein [Pseudomonadota bacterium]NBX86188.1 hypothetical protein [Pseudomonadota bacterium]